MIVGFDPIIAEEPRVMILGSMPSVTSLERRQYYGYPSDFVGDTGRD